MEAILNVILHQQQCHYSNLIRAVFEIIVRADESSGYIAVEVKCLRNTCNDMIFFMYKRY